MDGEPRSGADQGEREPGGPPRRGIPGAPEGSPTLGAGAGEFDQGTPVGPTPACDFWAALYGRRSVRRFKPDPVPRELVQQVMHAGIWAPSSCNYQMWDLVAVDEPEVNARLAALSLQMGNAPVNLIVSYGRDFSEEHFANIQSASALIQNMSLAASVLGLGTFWITQMGDAERVRELVGLPRDRLVVAVLALGFPRTPPGQGPRRRPLHQVAHWNHYAGRPIPSSADPARWASDLLATYQRARVLNGLRHNKPRSWEVRALLELLERAVPEGRTASAAEHADAPRWLDVLPCNGIVTERLSRERRGFRFDVVERTPEVAHWCARRTEPQARFFAWPAEAVRDGFDSPPEGAYAVVSCFFRLEGLAPCDRRALVGELARWVAPGGRVLVGFVSKRSFHDLTERLRARRGGPRGVEYVLSPDPNIGPFEALPPAEVERSCRDARLRIVARLALQAVPPPDEIAFRARNFGPRARALARGLGLALGALERVPLVRSALARFRFLVLTRA